MIIQAIILAAGKGTRMGYNDLPKVLVPLKNKPMILYMIEELGKLETQLPHVVVVGHQYQLVQAMLGSKHLYAFQEGQLGTAHAVISAKKHVSAENVLVLYGDMPFIKADSLKELIGHHKLNRSALTIFTTNVPHFENDFFNFLGFGRIIRDKNNRIASIKEFVDINEQEKNIKELNSGVYIFNTNWLWDNIGKVAKNRYGEYYLTDIIGLAREQGIMIYSLTIDPYEVFGINTPPQLEQAERVLLQRASM